MGEQIWVGSIHYPGHPVWLPLKRAVGEERLGDFMFMFALNLSPREGGESWKAYAYKHIEARTYIYLDGNGNAYEWRRDHYVTVPLDQALQKVTA